MIADKYQRRAKTPAKQFWSLRRERRKASRILKIILLDSPNARVASSVALRVASRIASRVASSVAPRVASKVALKSPKISSVIKYPKGLP